MNLLEIKRIPSLDGLRAVSIILVVFGHAFRSQFKFIDVANLGVRVFFVISAFLIVGILKRDIEKQQFSLKRFYFKRLMRTFPAYYVYLFLVMILLFILNEFKLEQFWRAPIYLENYHPRNLWESQQWFVGHSWSLAVEEQFYIFISLLFFLVHKKIINQFGLIKILFFLICLAPLIRASYQLFDWIPIVLSGSIHRSFETVVDSIAIGGVIAMLPISKLKKRKEFLFFKRKIWLLVLIILAIQFLNSIYIRELFGLRIRFLYNLFGLTIVNLLIGVMLVIVVSYPKTSIFTKILNSKPFIYIGMLSYSIYLWQQVWLYHWDFSLILKFIGLIVCSLGSYYFIELKFLSIRNNYLSKLNK